MGERTITEFFCDRCNAVLDKKPHYGEKGTYQLTASVDYAIAGDTPINWKELCVDCNKYVKDVIEDLKEIALVKAEGSE